MKKGMIFLLCLLFAVASVSVAESAQEGITDTEIHLGTFGPLTGPAAAWGGVVYGIETVVNLVNEEGGVHGRKIVLHVIDDRYNPAMTMAGVKRLQENVGIFAWLGGVGTTPCLSVMDYLTSKGVPWIAPQSGAEELISPPKKNIFTFYPINSAEATVLCRYGVEKLGMKHIAMVYQNDPYGINGLKGAKAELATHGLELIQIPVEKNDSDMTAVAYKLMKTKADAVLIWLNSLATMQVMQAAKKMNYQPQWMEPAAVSDFEVSYAISRGLIEGMIADTYANLKSPMLAKYKTAHQRLGRPGMPWTASVLAGAGIAELATEGIRRCGPALTREAFIHAMEGIHQFEGLSTPVSYDKFDPQKPESRLGIRQIYLTRCLKDGKTEVLTDNIPIQLMAK